MTPERTREWAVLLAQWANQADWPVSPDGFEPFVLSIAAEAIEPPPPSEEPSRFRCPGEEFDLCDGRHLEEK